MSTKSIRLAMLLAGSSLLAACATRDEVAALRQPAMPPLAVAKARGQKGVVELLAAAGGKE